MVRLPRRISIARDNLQIILIRCDAVWMKEPRGRMDSSRGKIRGRGRVSRGSNSRDSRDNKVNEANSKGSSKGNRDSKDKTASRANQDSKIPKAVNNKVDSNPAVRKTAASRKATE